jgi:hypothetical protein
VDTSKETREIRHEYTRTFPTLLNQLGVSLLVSTYQAGKVVAVGVAQGDLALRYHNFECAMGLAVKADAIAVGARAQVWFSGSSDFFVGGRGEYGEAHAGEGIQHLAVAMTADSVGQVSPTGSPCCFSGAFGKALKK